MQKEMLEELVLHFGFDDSNHAGERKGEIIVATASLYNQDRIKAKHGKRANYQRAEQWLLDPNHDYRFTILLDESFRHLNTNLSTYAPDLVKSFLHESQDHVNKVTLNFDGKLQMNERAFLRKAFQKIEEIEINNFTKTKHRYNCPIVVYMADAIAHNLYKKPFSTLIEDKRYVPIK